MTSFLKTSLSLSYTILVPTLFYVLIKWVMSWGCYNIAALRQLRHILTHYLAILLKWDTKHGHDFRRIKVLCIGNSMICSDIWHKYHEWYFEIVIRDNFEISRVVFMPNYAIICLYYYLQRVCNFHM